jgi:phenylpyruvate tautomerase PptA (4-oxalocrotonate tautomerase family)
MWYTGVKGEHMPYISITVGQKLSALQRQMMKTEFGRLISILPGKTEPDLIVNIHDGGAVYMGGAEVPCVFIDLRVYGKADEEAKKRFAEEIFAYITHVLGIPPEHQYLTISEHDHWGYDGQWH